MFYEFVQNNSGGSFTFDEKAGLTHFVHIEADSPEQANDIAERKGIYFNGCEDGGDCPCCGDRWDPVFDHDGSKVPANYGTPLDELDPDAFYFIQWMPDGKEMAIHYKDGTIEWRDVHGRRSHDY